jgi:hypothetical protein
VCVCVCVCVYCCRITDAPTLGAFLSWATGSHADFNSWGWFPLTRMQWVLVASYWAVVLPTFIGQIANGDLKQWANWPADDDVRRQGADGVTTLHRLRAAMSAPLVAAATMANTHAHAVVNGNGTLSPAYASHGLVIATFTCASALGLYLTCDDTAALGQCVRRLAWLSRGY